MYYMCAARCARQSHPLCDVKRENITQNNETYYHYKELHIDLLLSLQAAYTYINVFLLCFIKCPCVLQRGMRFYMCINGYSRLSLSWHGESIFSAGVLLLDQLF